MQGVSHAGGVHPRVVVSLGALVGGDDGDAVEDDPLSRYRPRWRRRGGGGRGGGGSRRSCRCGGGGGTCWKCCCRSGGRDGCGSSRCDRFCRYIVLGDSAKLSAEFLFD